MAACWAAAPSLAALSFAAWPPAGAEHRINHLAMLDLADRIEGCVGGSRAGHSVASTAVTPDGRAATVEATRPTGSPAKPLLNARLAERFRDCAARAAKPVEARPLIDATMELETLVDLRAICV